MALAGRWRLGAAAFGLLFVVCGRQATAQVAAADSTLDSARAVLLSIPLGSRIRILTVGHAIIDGRLAGRSDSVVTILQGRDSARATVERTASIWLPAPNYKSGAIAGGVFGGVVGALALGTLATGLCESAHCNGAFAAGAAVGAGIGGAIGVVIGLGLGALTHHWKQVWP